MRGIEFLSLHFKRKSLLVKKEDLLIYWPLEQGQRTRKFIMRDLL